ncbi:MAG TPA: glutamyl-tRNA reductase [Tepidisphaeraceae bacterium]|jgi:glutamyl-tRNA reductase|nr:glutamyl-tRNA reductase [Tepidisphaeraceae bacterium]
MHRLLLLGLNHSTAPLDVREKLAFNDSQRRSAMLAFKEQFPESEAVLISTCNRVELYTARAVHGHPRPEEMIAFLAQFHGIDPAQFQPHLYEKSNIDVVRHLFSVASSLDSMVLGETQIIGQVREAYDLARELQSAGPMLHPLFQRAIAVGKQVMTQTPLAEGRLSVASVAVDYARQIFDHFNDKTVLSIGAGEMAQLTLQHFQNLRPGRLLVCNRDPAKADALAKEFTGQPVAFDRLPEWLVQADIVISSTGSPHPILTRSHFDGLLKLRRYRPIFLIDIALPRDIDPSIAALEHVYLYNLDDLQKVVRGTQDQRRGAIDSASLIVDREVREFAVWHRQREVGPVIERLYSRYHRIAQDELSRTLKKLPDLSPEDRAQVEELARRLVNKLLNDPVQTLRQGAADEPHAGPTGPYLHAMEKLFKLTEPDDEHDQTPPQP